MVHSGRKQVLRPSSLARGFCAIALVVGLNGCSCSDSNSPAAALTPAGGLAQESLRGPITYTTGKGWRISIHDGSITVKPPEGQSTIEYQYVSQGTREHLGTQDLREWAGDRRSILLPGRAKITLHGQSGRLIRLSLYDETESHEIDVLTQTIMHSKVNGDIARARDEAEYDGETGHLHWFPWGDSQRLYLGNLYMQDENGNSGPLREELSLLPLGRQDAETAYAFSDPGPAFPSQTGETCDETPQARGGLVRLANEILEYSSRSGLWTVRVDQYQVIVTRKMGSAYQAKWEVWGDPHENLNGKHIKDWEGTRRTLILDDGTKITMDSEGPHGVVHTTSIYDGAQSHEIGNAGNQIRHSCVHAQTAAQRDAEEIDGEAAHLVILRSPASVAGSLFVENIYTEAEGEGGGIERTFNPAMLGETGEADINPNQVNDYHDDPRLGHT